MKTPLIVKMLRSKAARVKGELRASEVRADKLRDDLVHLQAVIRLYVEEEDLEQLGPIAPQLAGKMFKRGECSRTALEILRKANAPMSAHEIALQVIQLRGLGDLHWKQAKAVECAVHDALRRRAGTLLERIDGYPMRWAVRR